MTLRVLRIPTLSKTALDTIILSVANKPLCFLWRQISLLNFVKSTISLSVSPVQFVQRTIFVLERKWILDQNQNVLNSKLRILTSSLIDRRSDRRGYKCVAINATFGNDADCSESFTFVRVKDKFAALWYHFRSSQNQLLVIGCIIFDKNLRLGMRVDIYEK